MELETILAADASASAVRAKAQSDLKKTFESISDAIKKREQSNNQVKDDLVRMANPTRILDIKQSRVPKDGSNPLGEILSRTEGEADAPKGNLVVLAVSLDEGSNAQKFYDHVAAFKGSIVVGADLFGLNAQSDINIHDTNNDTRLEKTVNEIAALAQNQAGMTCEVFAKREPFKGVYNQTLRSIQNGN